MNPIEVTASLIALILAITIHEAAHGAMALLFGDDTAKRMGRLTFNPINHVDPLGTVILPGLMFLSGSPFLFGWAKPVPVNFGRLKPARIGLIAVALAGPGINLILAWLSAVLLHINGAESTLGNDILQSSIRINVVLAAFNLLPLLPLDGGRVLSGLLPPSLAAQYMQTERYGFIILMALIMLPSLLAIMGVDFSPLRLILLPIVQFLLNGILMLSGHL